MTDRHLHTKFGTAKIQSRGYYRITSGKEGNNGKYLHRLIFEDFYGTIPKDYIVHHKNGDKLDNCILNLQLMSKSEHHKLHNGGENNPMYGKPLSDKHKQKISKANCGKFVSEETRKKLSESNKGKKNRLKKEARIVKNGFPNGKRSYAIRKDGKRIKTSYSISTLVKWFKDTFPNEELIMEGY